MNARLSSLLSKAGIHTAAVSVLGRFVHIDTSACHNERLQHILTASGFAVLSARDCYHLDGYKGFRVIARLARPS